MGTPEFAVATLGSLLMNGYDVPAVVTAPDKEAGRGRKIRKSAVGEFAEFSKIPVLQPVSLKDPAFISELKDLKADVFIVVAFRMLPREVWEIPPLGTINLHASLLPDYRGAAPINHAIINGETNTGVTTFLIDEKIDTGNILLNEVVPIFPDENAGELHDRLMVLGARLMIRTLEELSENHIKPVPQSVPANSELPAKSAPKIHPENCIINWDLDSTRVNNLVRGLSPYPGARSVLINSSSSISFKIYESQPETEEHSFKPGTICTDDKNFIRICCGKGYLKIISLQLEGRKRMSTSELLRGFKISDYTIQTN